MVKGTHKITVRLRPKAGVTASGKDGNGPPLSSTVYDLVFLLSFSYILLLVLAVLLPCAAAVSWTAAFN